jgi:signal transduction histidine kinase
MKIQSKITLLFFLVAATGLVLINAAIFYFVSEFSFEDFFKRLEARVNLTAEINIYPNDKSSSYQEIRSRYLEKLEGETEYVTKINNAGDLKFKKPLNLPDKFYRTIITAKKARYNKDNKFYAGALIEKKQEYYIVIVSATDPYGFKELQTLKKVLLLIFAISLVLTYATGKIFSHFTVRPVRNVIRSVKNISANNIHMRLEEIRGKDEISELIFTFNNMLNRLETAFETQNNFVSNASHELKTPLSIIIGEVELLRSQKNLSLETQQSAKVIHQYAEKLSQIISSLLGLAQSGFDGKKQNWQNIRIDELIILVADSVKKIDQESIINVDFSELPANENDLYTEGNINLLQLALSNIVRNACKYSNNKPVLITLSIRNGRILLVVADQGIGIPETEQQHIFEPFFRASNTSKFEGYGIGLPLTLNIIRLHNGTIGIRSKEEIGTEMQISLPIANSQHPEAVISAF